ncbi:possible type I restriction enzyme, R subunit [Psychrobacter arcticus 273-4]|uniref:Possible type I restriction enzyme, R subunit n=1 Tax=Psychrobacter arcticus (strain DSM 17307 / VKM B-2377 / 273-4) TaxID=259536 RepID=Q4FUM1_PSYA2|nr:DEAD/DEAH box helicase family protein [Psychrobacter arcticus]AAZ18287.1 possible type I restriction enzyme, R subunit [Psychrobacter arcticus 273-4]
MANAHNVTYESVFQADIVSQMQAQGWQLGHASGYQAETALYEQDVLDFVQSTQPQEWEKFCRTFPIDSERHFITALVKQLNKADEHSTDRASRTYGTLGVLRHGLKIRNARFSLCQFKPEHSLNPETMTRYEANICRVVSEVIYSPHVSLKDSPKDKTDGKVAKRNRIDIVLFVNGLPVTTMELKSEFKQAVQNAITQYKKTRLPKDPDTKKPEPLLTFKRGALVHFAVSQYEVYMTTKLAGDSTYFLPFNKGTEHGGAGNDTPSDSSRYATDYLWNEVLTPENLLSILGHFMHLQIDEEEDAIGRKSKKEILMFPRYHQWDVVTKLVNAAVTEGAGQKYLIQHSAGSGKSNSIAWTAHQLSTLYNDQGDKQFHSVIVITDRTILDDQLQETIYQFEHADGVVGKINRKEGDGSKSEKLAEALVNSQPIIIVTIQTFPFVLKAIEDSSVLKSRRYAIIADEAHSSQTGSTARQLKEVLVSGDIESNTDDDKPLSSEDSLDFILDATLAARRSSPNLSYYAFTATPKPKTIELFGRLPNPDLPASKDNLPAAYHVYSMRQAIEEGFILDVLKNYTNYKVVYQLKQKLAAADDEVDARRAKIKLNSWVRLHEHNIAQKVKIIIEHFNDNIKGLLGGQAKAMVVTGSRKEAVRYKIAFDNYIADYGYRNINAMVAFSGEVTFNDNDPDSGALIGEKFTEHNMNIGLKGRDLRKAFDSDDYQVMLVANKFQTGFDQPKLCAMYVDKKLTGVDCVQTLSRLNRTYKGKAESGTFVLDFFNDPEDILEAFQPYYETAHLADVSDPDQVFDLYEKLRVSGIFTKNEVEQFVEAFYSKNKSNAAISNICKPAVERWQKQYHKARTKAQHAKTMLERTKATGDVVLMTNAENDYKGFKTDQDALEIFKKDLGTFTRQYEFMSQIVDYDSKDLEKLSLYARNLQPLLRESLDNEEDVDLSNIVMSHYRVSILHQQDLKLQEGKSEYQLDGGSGAGTATPKDIKEAFLSQIIERLNEVFVTDNLTDKDMLNYAHTLRDKLSENTIVMTQIASNPKAQALLGDFPNALDDAVISSGAAHQEQMIQLLSDPAKMTAIGRVVYDMLCVNSEKAKYI